MKRLALVLALLAWAGAAEAETVREWAFDVYLDGKPIGEHRFTVSTDGDRTTVRSRARFDVKLLGFTAYRYRHESDESWRAGCLQSVRARTDDDGQALKVDAALVDGALQVTSDKGVASYPGCVMSFGYWNPAIREQTKLLNVQTGEFMPVVFAALANQAVEARGDAVTASHWKLSGADHPIELWYGAGDDWLALESTVSGGRKLRYRLRQTP